MSINRDKVHAAAAKLLQQGKFDKAIAELVKLVEDDATDVRTWLKLGETYPKIGKKKEALDAFEKAATIYSEQGFFLKAVAVLKQLLRVDPNVPPMHLKLAELYQQLGLTPDALQHYQNVAVFYEQQGKARDALDILKRMVDLDPDNLPSRIKLGELFAQQGLQQEALQEFRGALTFLKNQQRFDDYTRVGEKLVAYDPAALDVARELAQIYLTQKQPSLALSKLQIAFKFDARNVETLVLMAQAFLDMQQVAKTVLVYKELAKIHTTDGNSEAATRQWEQVLAIAPDDADAAGALGRAPATGAAAVVTAPPQDAAASAGRAAPAPVSAGAPAGAPAAGRAAPAADPQLDQLARLLTETDVYVKYGLKDKAVEHLKKIFAIKPDHIPGLEKQKQLLQPQGGRELKDVLRRLVAAADDQGHPRLAEWKAELSQTDNKPASAARPGASLSSMSGASVPPEFAATAMRERPQLSRSASAEEIVIDSQEGFAVADEPIGLDQRTSDTSAFPDDIASLPDLPPDVEEQAQPADELPEIVPEPATSPAARQIPRMPSGVVTLPTTFPGFPRPGAPLPLAQPRPPDPPLVLSEEASDSSLDYVGGDPSQMDADAVVRQALRDISQEELSAAADDLLLEAEPDDLLSAEGMLIGEEELPPDALLADDHGLLGAEELPPDDAVPPPVEVVSTALMGLSPAELDEIREFEGDTHDPAVLSRPPQQPVRSVPSGMPVEPLSDLPENDDTFGFEDRTLSLAPDASSNSPTDERPRTTPGRPTVPNESPVPVQSRSDDAAMAERSGEFDPNSFELPDEVKAMLGTGAASPDSAAVAMPVQDADLSVVQGAPLESALQGAPVEAAPDARGKLGLAGKAQGFENDQATQFFPDELEECEFFISQDLLDEAKEILNNILEDVPDSARVQWMLARIEAKETDQPEPPAPWETRILEEVQAQLDELDLPAPPVQSVGERQVSVEEVLSAFKKGIAETVPEEDAATHYDLGCAYRDMGLLDEAISEFTIAGRAPSKAADSRYLIGVTRTDQGRLEDAVAAFEEALATPNSTRDQRAACHYQLGACHESVERFADAQRAYKQAKVLGHLAVDLDRRINAMIAKVGDVELSPGPGSNGQNGHGHAAASAAPAKAKNIDYL